MNIIKKMIISIFLIECIIILFSINFNVVNGDSTGKTLTQQATDFITIGGDNVGEFDATNIVNEFVDLGKILSYIGAGIMVAVTSYLGVQYIMSPPDKQAVLKEKLIGVVVSGVVIFGAYKIWNIVINIVKGF